MKFLWWLGLLTRGLRYVTTVLFIVEQWRKPLLSFTKRLFVTWKYVPTIYPGPPLARHFHCLTRLRTCSTLTNPQATVRLHHTIQQSPSPSHKCLLHEQNSPLRTEWPRCVSLSSAAPKPRQHSRPCIDALDRKHQSIVVVSL